MPRQTHIKCLTVFNSSRISYVDNCLRYEGRYDSNASYSSLRTYNYNYNENYIYHGFILYKYEKVLPQNVHSQYTLSTFTCEALRLSRQTLMKRHLFMLAALQFVVFVGKTAFSECVLQGARKIKFQGAKAGL